MVRCLKVVPNSEPFVEKEAPEEIRERCISKKDNTFVLRT